jgi:hypothetical protein
MAGAVAFSLVAVWVRGFAMEGVGQTDVQVNPRMLQKALYVGIGFTLGGAALTAYGIRRHRRLVNPPVFRIVERGDVTDDRSINR